MPTNCDTCGTFTESPEGYTRNFCDSCIPNKHDGIPAFKQMVPNSVCGSIPKSEIDEIRRHRMLPYEKPGGGYYAGRMGDNGKIQEKPIKN